MRTLLSLILCCMLSTGGILAQQAEKLNALPSVALPLELERVLRDYERAWGNHDAAGLAALFSADGLVLRPGRPPVRVREAIENAYRHSGGRLHLRAFAFEQSDSLAYIIGGYTSTPEWPDAGTFTLVLTQAPDGEWLIQADMDNRNR